MSIISALLVLPSTANSVSLSTITDREIQGAEPRLSEALENNIKDQKFSRFGFTYTTSPGISTDYDDSNINSFPLVASSVTPSSLKSQLKSTFKDTLIGDDATDANGDDNFKLVGIDNTNINKELGSDELSIKIRDGANNDITTSTTNFCDLLSSNPGPYKIEISNNLRLTTKYGDPNRKNYTAATVETDNQQPSKQYLFSIVLGACYAQPNLDYGPFGADWVASKGFKFQSEGINFPTTGSNGLSFKLTIVGVTAQDVINTMTSTVQASPLTNVNLLLSVESTNILKVTLQGPRDGATADTAKFSPSTFKLKVGTTEIYSFTIGKWFIVKPGGGWGYSATNLYCNALDYRLPKRIDYTNNIYLSNRYTRSIGGGLFAEWGSMSGYNNSDWGVSGHSWTSEWYSASYPYSVRSSDGDVAFSNQSFAAIKAVCVVP